MRGKIFNSYTGWLVAINVVVFLIYIIFAYFYGPLKISYILGIQPFMVLHGRHLWTFLTSMFLHASVWHLAANMISLIFIGGFVEKIIGKKRFLYIYFIGGFVASLFFVLLAGFFGNSDLGARLFGDPLSLAVGASGAIFAIGGLLAVLTPKMKVLAFFIIPMPMWVAMIFLTFAMWLFSASLDLPIGNTAHLGGLIAGVTYGVYLRYRYPNKTQMISKYFGG